MAGIFPKCVNGSGLIVASDGHGSYLEMTVIGSSMKTSARAGEKVWQLGVFPEKGKDGVVAVAFYDKGWQNLAVRVHWDGDRLCIDDGRVAAQFLNPTRIGQLYSPDGCFWIEVEIRGRRYTSNPERVGSGFYYVADPDLLCRYWAGDVGPDAVIHVAIETKKEESVWEQLAEAKRELAEKKARLETAGSHLDKMDEALGRLVSHSAEQERELSAWRCLARELARLLRLRWFIGKELRRMLQNPML